MNDLKQSLIEEIQRRVDEKILEQTNADLLIKLIRNAESNDEAINIAALGTTYKRTGLHFDKRLEKMSDTIRYFKKNERLSFASDKNKPTHKLIIGDNYEALQNLLVQYKGQIDVIYIDPPYGKDSLGEFAKTNYTNAITRDNLLSMLYPRLFLAKQLLSDEGVIFCSIDDKNQAYVKCLFDEVFGEENFVGNLPTIMNLKGNQDEYGFAGTHEYTLVYTKTVNGCAFYGFNIDEDEQEEWLEDEIGFYKEGATLKRTGVAAPRESRPFGYFPILIDKNKKNIKMINDSEFQKIYNKAEKQFNDNFIEELKERYSNYDFILPITDNQKMSWRWSYEKIVNEKNEIIIKETSDGYSLYKKQRPNIGDLPTKKPKSTFYKPEYSSGNGTAQLKSIFSDKNFNNPKPIDLLKDLFQLVTRTQTNAEKSHTDSSLLTQTQQQQENITKKAATLGEANPCGNSSSIILDFFAGSGTTGHAVLDLNKADGGNRTFILCQCNEKTEANPNGIAYDVTSKRLKRIMTGSCYDGNTDFPWAKGNEPYGGNLDVYEIEHISNLATQNQNPFEAIDETLYGKEKFEGVKEKIEWVCSNFENTQKEIE